MGSFVASHDSWMRVSLSFSNAATAALALVLLVWDEARSVILLDTVLLLIGTTAAVAGIGEDCSVEVALAATAALGGAEEV